MNEGDFVVVGTVRNVHNLLSFGLWFLWFGIVWCWRSISCFRLLASLPYMSIKTREYCSRGLPFVYGYEDDGFTGKEPYVRQVTNSPEPVDMNEIIELYEATAQNRDVIAEMRNYAEKNFSWDVLLKDVVEYMKNEGR